MELYKIPESVIEDIENLKKELERYKNGEIDSFKFRAFRVPLGIYQQRNQLYMVRIRIPGGVLKKEIFKNIVEIGEKYGFLLHLTTRQDIQFQNVSLELLPIVYRELFNIGLTSKGGGGNTVRNITSCFLSGLCLYEKFDVYPYAVALTEYLIPQTSSYNLPRKFKISFSGCEKDCSFAEINDIGFIAKIKDGKKGFSLYFGGGMGAHSKLAEKFSDFIPEEEVIYYTEAIKMVFDKYGNRRDRRKARFRFVLEKIGVDETKKLIKSFYEEVRTINLKLNIKEIKRDKNLIPIKIPVFCGDLSPKDGKRIYEFLAKNNLEYLTISPSQDIYIFVEKEKIEKIKENLPLKENFPIICCKGALTCSLGICYSTKLAEAIKDKIKEENLQLSEDFNIKISGCPNCCGQHIIGMIGFSGQAKRYNGHFVPFYNIWLGGKIEENKSKLAENFGSIPSKNVPVFLMELIKKYKETKIEDFYRFIEKHSKEIKEMIGKYKKLPKYEENPESYYDWGSNEELKISVRGPGECGAGVYELVEMEIENSKNLFKEKKYKEALFRIFSGILLFRGIEAKDFEQAKEEFIKNFIMEGWVSKKYMEILSKEDISEDEEKVKSLIERIIQLYNSIDSNLKFTIPKEEITTEEVKSFEGKILDLRTVPCPINYVKAKLFLENVNPGEEVEILLDDGEPIKNVPSSLENDGEEIIKIEKKDNYFSVIVKKGS